MQSLTLILIMLNLALINCQNLRNLMLTMAPEKLKYLSEIASNTLNQLLGVEIDFKGRGLALIENKNHKVEIALYDNQEVPIEDPIRFEVVNWSPKIPEIPINETRMTIFGKIYDVKEQFNLAGQLIANAIQDGSVIYYKQAGDDIIANTRFRCFIKKNNQEYGSFEIAIEDKNDKKSILDSIKNLLSKITADDVLKFVEKAARISSLIIGVKKDWFSISSFLNFPYLIILLLFGLLLS